MINSVYITSYLRYFDEKLIPSLFAANLVLEDTVERIYHGSSYADTRVGLFLIRGENVVLLGEVVSILCFHKYGTNIQECTNRILTWRTRSHWNASRTRHWILYTNKKLRIRSAEIILKHRSYSNSEGFAAKAVKGTVTSPSVGLCIVVRLYCQSTSWMSCHNLRWGLHASCVSFLLSSDHHHSPLCRTHHLSTICWSWVLLIVNPHSASSFVGTKYLQCVSVFPVLLMLGLWAVSLCPAFQNSILSREVSATWTSSIYHQPGINYSVTGTYPAWRSHFVPPRHHHTASSWVSSGSSPGFESST